MSYIYEHTCTRKTNNEETSTNKIDYPVYGYTYKNQDFPETNVSESLIMLTIVTKTHYKQEKF